MKILALESGKTVHGKLTYAIVWRKDDGVYMLRFLDEPFNFSWRESNEICKTSLFNLIWCAHNMADPAFGHAPRARRAEVQDYDYAVLVGLYQKFLQQAQGLLSYSKWVDTFISEHRAVQPHQENPGALPDSWLLLHGESGARDHEYTSHEQPQEDRNDPRP